MDNSVKWKLQEFLEANGLTVNALVERAPGLSRTGVYRLASDDLKGVRFESLGVIIPALRELTHKNVEIADLLEYVGPPAPREAGWRQRLAGAFEDPDSPGDVAERHDDYLDDALDKHHAEHL